MNINELRKLAGLPSITEGYKEAKKPVTKDAVTKLLIKYGNNPQEVKKMVDKEFDSAVKRHPTATASKIADVISVVYEEVDVEESLGKMMQKQLDKDRKKQDDTKKKIKARGGVIGGKGSGVKMKDDEEAKLNETGMRKYEYKDGKVYISRANFRKVHKDYKGGTKDEPRMLVYDNKKGTVSAPVIFVEGVHRDQALYFDTYSSAIQHAINDTFKKHKLEVDADDYFQKINMGPGKPADGDTTRHSIGLIDIRTGNASRKALHIQVYNRGTNRNTFELNYYVA